MCVLGSNPIVAWFIGNWDWKSNMVPSCSIVHIMIITRSWYVSICLHSVSIEACRTYRLPTAQLQPLLQWSEDGYGQLDKDLCRCCCSYANPKTQSIKEKAVYGLFECSRFFTLLSVDSPFSIEIQDVSLNMDPERLKETSKDEDMFGAWLGCFESPCLR